MKEHTRLLGGGEGRELDGPLELPERNAASLIPDLAAETCAGLLTENIVV